MLKRTYGTGKPCKWTGVAVKPRETEFLKRSLIDASMKIIISSEKGGNLYNISCYLMSIHARIRCTEESHLRRPESQNDLNELKFMSPLGKERTPLLFEPYSRKAEESSVSLYFYKLLEPNPIHEHSCGNYNPDDIKQLSFKHRLFSVIQSR